MRICGLPPVGGGLDPGVRGGGSGLRQMGLRVLVMGVGVTSAEEGQRWGKGASARSARLSRVRLRGQGGHLLWWRSEQAVEERVRTLLDQYQVVELTGPRHYPRYNGKDEQESAGRRAVEAVLSRVPRIPGDDVNQFPGGRPEGIDGRFTIRRGGCMNGVTWSHLWLVGLAAHAGCAASGGASCPAPSDTSVQDEETLEAPHPAPVDVLLVVDTSGSMCRTVEALPLGFGAFVSRLVQSPFIDARVAVVGVTARGDLAGKFRNKPAPVYVPACEESVPADCKEDLDCSARFGAGWECNPAGESGHAHNGAVFGSCQLPCGSHKQCEDVYCSPWPGLTQQDGSVGLLDGLVGADCSYGCTQSGACIRQTPAHVCPGNLPFVLSGGNLRLLPCLVVPEFDYSVAMMSALEEGFSSAWLALDPQGPNAAQSAQFLRKDASLLIVFVSNQDDCSVDPAFCSPTLECDSDSDCPTGGRCMEDPQATEVVGTKQMYCCGAIPEGLNEVCEALGEYRGLEHHACAYDEECVGCSDEADCPAGWTCAAGGKCRPSLASFDEYASYQHPQGVSLFALESVESFAAKYRTLKSGEQRVLVAALAGDGRVLPSDADSLISQACLDDEASEACQSYSSVKASSPVVCLDAPTSSGCEAFYSAKLACVRECALASAQGTPVCQGPLGSVRLGSRYMALVEEFGADGWFGNLCGSETGMAETAVSLADWLSAQVIAQAGVLPVR